MGKKNSENMKYSKIIEMLSNIAKIMLSITKHNKCTNNYFIANN